MSKVDLFAAIRRDSRAGLSVGGLARKCQVSRRTVWPAARNPMSPRPSKLDPFKQVIDGILRADLDADRKPTIRVESSRRRFSWSWWSRRISRWTSTLVCGSAVCRLRGAH